MTQIFDLFGLMSNLIFCIDERLRDLEIWYQRLGINCFLIFLTILYLQCYCLLPSLIVLIKELPGNARLASGFFPDVLWGITKDFVYLEFTDYLTNGTTGVNIYGIYLLLEENLAIFILFLALKDFLNKLWFNRQYNVHLFLLIPIVYQIEHR